MPRVSVVVPTLNRPDLLGRCLAALLRQDLPSLDYEIVVVDDGPHEATRQLFERYQLRALALRPGLRMVCCRNDGQHGPAAARNLGWRTAQAPVIAFTDDDTVPARDWLSAGLAKMDEGATAVWGRVRVPLPQQPTDYELDAAGLDGAVFVTANCFVRTQALRDLGGFDERFRLAWREDSDLYFRLMQRFRRILSAPEAVVLHPIRPGKFGISIRQQRKSMFDALLFKKHPMFYRMLIRARPPVSYYVAVLFLVAAIIALVSGHVWIFALMLLVWVALAVRFTFFRLRSTSHELRHVAEMFVTSLLIPPVAVYWRLRGALQFRVPFF